MDAVRPGQRSNNGKKNFMLNRNHKDKIISVYTNTGSNLEKIHEYILVTNK